MFRRARGESTAVRSEVFGGRKSIRHLGRLFGMSGREPRNLCKVCADKQRKYEKDYPSKSSKFASKKPHQPLDHDSHHQSKSTLAKVADPDMLDKGNKGDRNERRYGP